MRAASLVMDSYSLAVGGTIFVNPTILPEQLLS